MFAFSQAVSEHIPGNYITKLGSKKFRALLSAGCGKLLGLSAAKGAGEPRCRLSLLLSAVPASVCSLVKVTSVQ